MAVTGNYLPGSGATLEIEIGGLIAGTEFDVLNVTGDATLAGMLELILIDGFVPENSDTFVIVSANSILGSFSNALNGERLNTADGGGSFIVNFGSGSAFNENQIVLSEFLVGGILLGDVNGDGMVNLLDVAPFVDAISTGTFIPEADVNQDGSVDLLDVSPFVALLAG